MVSAINLTFTICIFIYQVVWYRLTQWSDCQTGCGKMTIWRERQTVVTVTFQKKQLIPWLPVHYRLYLLGRIWIPTPHLSLSGLDYYYRHKRSGRPVSTTAHISVRCSTFHSGESGETTSKHNASSQFWAVAKTQNNVSTSRVITEQAGNYYPFEKMTSFCLRHSDEARGYC